MPRHPVRADRMNTASRAVILALALALVAAAGCAPSSQPPLSPTAVSVGAADVTLAAAGQPKPAGKPAYYLSALVTFGDRSGDAIVSDGLGAYPAYDGSTGCELLSGNLGCILQGTSRSLNYSLSGVISGSGPTGTLNDYSNFTVNGVGNLAISATMTAQALFHTAIGQFNFNTSGDANTSNVLVTRVDAHTWTVDTSAGDVANLVQPDPNRRNRTVTVGYYHLPFKFTGVTQ
jgi:hypothetical protein